MIHGRENHRSFRCRRPARITRMGRPVARAEFRAERRAKSGAKSPAESRAESLADSASAPAAPSLGEACDQAAGLPSEIDVATPDRTLLEGVTERRPDALAAAVRACEAAAREEPDTARFPHRIGLALLALGRPAEARAPLARAMEHGYAGGYREIALGRAEGTFAPAWPKDEADAISIASEGVARTEVPNSSGSLAACCSGSLRRAAAMRRGARPCSAMPSPPAIRPPPPTSPRFAPAAYPTVSRANSIARGCARSSKAPSRPEAERRPTFTAGSWITVPGCRRISRPRGVSTSWLRSAETCGRCRSSPP